MASRNLILTVVALIGLGVGLTSANDDAKVGYLGNTAKIWSEAEGDQPPIGKLLVTTPVEILSQEGDWIEVTLNGWTQSGAERVLYAAPGIRILRAAVRKSAVDRLEFSQSQEDNETGLTWTRSRLQGWLHKPAIHPSLQAIWKKAEPLFAERCTACHQRRIPNHYTANQWNSYLKIMGPRTGLPKEDQFLIRAYLQHHAKDSDRLSEMN